jgi:sphinganine C4-monooxygenase
MSTRQSMWFFTFSTIKTVDDHCGYAFPWDPLQHITGNNSAYHDIHHQSWGIKTNYSQPFFIFWDRLLGTQWKGDASLRYQKSWVTAQKKVEMDSAKASNPQADTTPVPFSKEDEEGPVARKIGNQGMHTKAPSRSVQKEGLVGHLVTGSIRQK